VVFIVLRAELRAFFDTVFGDTASPAGLTARGGDPGGGPGGGPGNRMSGVGNDLGAVIVAPGKGFCAAATGMAFCVGIGGGRPAGGGWRPAGDCGNALASADEGGGPFGGRGVTALATTAVESGGGGGSVRVSGIGGGLNGAGVRGNCDCGCPAFSNSCTNAAVEPMASSDVGGVGLGGSTGNVGQGT
jgi:hypothetical protein